jgi:hypothetical protein
VVGKLSDHGSISGVNYEAVQSKATNEPIQGGHHDAWINQSNAALDAWCIHYGDDAYVNSRRDSRADYQHLRPKWTHQIS